ncbi:MAG: hypothetical protein NT080_01120 [Spirochaetes bacterium]|nr:hypothetical protein [Spirochaetota bacterium]
MSRIPAAAGWIEEAFGLAAVCVATLQAASGSAPPAGSRFSTDTCFESR